MIEQELSGYIYSDNFNSKQSVTDVLKSLLKQAGVPSFDRFIIEDLGLFKIFDNIDDAMECFKAMVYYKHTARLYVGYIKPDGNLFVCDEPKGFYPVYRSVFAFIPPRSKNEFNRMRKTLLMNGWVELIGE